MKLKCHCQKTEQLTAKYVNSLDVLFFYVKLETSFEIVHVHIYVLEFSTKSITEQEHSFV